MTPHEKKLTENMPDHVKKLYVQASKLRREKQRNDYKKSQAEMNRADYKP